MELEIGKTYEYWHQTSGGDQSPLLVLGPFELLKAYESIEYDWDTAKEVPCTLMDVRFQDGEIGSGLRAPSRPLLGVWQDFFLKEVKD